MFRFSLLIPAGLLAGCAAVPMAPLPPTHPASPQAPEGAPAPRGYSLRADAITRRTKALLTAAAQEAKAGEAAPTQPEDGHVR